jgi:hypothetical protein
VSDIASGEAMGGVGEGGACWEEVGEGGGGTWEVGGEAGLIENGFGGGELGAHPCT